MQINGLGDLNPLKRSEKRDRIGGAPGSAPHAAAAYGKAAGPSSSSDAVEISPVSTAMSKLSQVSDVRQERVAAIRSQVADGTYLTSERLEDGIRKMLQEI